MNICSNQCSFICMLKLVCISRTSDTVWSSKSVMSVSFATLVSPTQVESVSAVDLRKSSLILNIYSRHMSFIKIHSIMSEIYHQAILLIYLLSSPCNNDNEENFRPVKMRISY